MKTTILQEEINKLSEVLQDYFSTFESKAKLSHEQLTKALLESLDANFKALHHNGVVPIWPTEYDPETCWTAAELRAINIPIPDTVPDCGWVPRGAVQWTDVKTVPGEHPDVLVMDMTVKFHQPFHWLALPMPVTFPATVSTKP